MGTWLMLSILGLQMRNIILLALQSYQPPREATASLAATAAAAAQGAAAPAVPPAVGQSAYKMATHVFLQCLQVLMAFACWIKVQHS